LHPPEDTTTTYTCQTSYCYYCYVTTALESSGTYSRPSLQRDAAPPGSHFR
jgi:hypothetical protein